MLKNVLAAASASLVLGLVAAGGCSPRDSASLCADLCTCTPCTDNDLADCLDQADAAAQKAAGASCTPAFDAYLACARDNVRCHDPAAVNTKCLAEIGAVVACDNQVPILGTACQASVVKIQVCRNSPNAGSAGGTCLGTAACVANCVNLATCAQIKDVYDGSGTGEGVPLIACINACNNAPPPGD